MKKTFIAIFSISSMLLSCTMHQSNKSKPYHLITLDPGHFHAALVQKTMYDQVDSVVQVYAPRGNDLDLHIKRIDGYNNRKDNPTAWQFLFC